MLAQLLEHRGWHVDGVRIVERGDHAVDRAVNEFRRIRRVHIARLNELHHAEKAQHIIRIQPCRAEKYARREHGQHTPEKYRQNDNEN